MSVGVGRATSSNVKQLFQKYADVFNREMGVTNTEKILLELKENKVKLKFYHPRPIPYANRETVKEMLNKLVEEKVLEQVEVLEWAAGYWNQLSLLTKEH